MKYLILLAFISSAYAHEIKGTLPLKGTIKTKTTHKGQKISCEIDINKVKNLMEEDSFGNPAYKLMVGVEVRGSDDKNKIKIATNYPMTNLFTVKEKWSEVRDFEYQSAKGEAGLTIDEEGRLKSAYVIHNNEKINCPF